MLMPGRSYSSTAYKYGFNGQEKDDEVSGSGNINKAMFWEYDTRLGRRWNVDPVVKPWESNYATFSNNPILFNDPFGDDVEYGAVGSSKKEQKRVKMQVKLQRKMDSDFNEKFKEWKKDKGMTTRFIDMAKSEFEKDGKEHAVTAKNIGEAHITPGPNANDNQQFYNWNIGLNPLPNPLELNHGSVFDDKGKPIRYHESIKTFGLWMLAHPDSKPVLTIYNERKTEGDIYDPQYRDHNNYLRIGPLPDEPSRTFDDLSLLRRQFLVDALLGNPYIQFTKGMRKIKIEQKEDQDMKRRNTIIFQGK
jgi:hypothetical protein